MPKDDKFTLLNKITELDMYIRDNIVCNIPKVHNDLRIHLLDEVYNLNLNLRYASFNNKSKRIKYIIDMLVNISMIDYLLGNIKNIKVKNTNNCIRLLNDIKNLTYKWKINEENGK